MTEPGGGLPVFTPDRPHWVWFVGCHGGSGETTLADLLPASGAADHRWPSGGTVVLVARTSASGLLAAQAALTQYANREVPDVALLGLILSLDTPLRLPRPLVDLAHLVAGGSPRTWYLPWVPQWRVGERADLSVTKRLFADIAKLTVPEEASL